MHALTPLQMDAHIPMHVCSHVCMHIHACVHTYASQQIQAQTWRGKQELRREGRRLKGPLRASQHHKPLPLISTFNFHITSYHIKAILLQVPRTQAVCSCSDSKSHFPRGPHCRWHFAPRYTPLRRKGKQGCWYGPPSHLFPTPAHFCVRLLTECCSESRESTAENTPFPAPPPGPRR